MCIRALRGGGRDSHTIFSTKKLQRRNTVNVNKHFEMLGLIVRDKVTGFQGTATSLAFDLYGCIQVLINPGLGKDQKLGEQIWFDIGRLKVVKNDPVMDVPDYEFSAAAEGKKGPAEKPPSTKA
jgi:hypothetical protein